MTPLERFREILQEPDLLTRLRDGVVGDGMMIPGPKGDVPLLYADYTASGRAVDLVEQFIAGQVLPFYANSHTEGSYCGSLMTRLREEARHEIARITGCDDGCRVVFAGAGATAGLNRLVSVLMLPERVAAGEKVVVLVGPYEHHSNLLPWRESGAQVIEIDEAAEGGPDLDGLVRSLSDHANADLLIGAFSAMSNVTGISPDIDDVTRLLKRHGALAIWDYAGGGPYLPMTMGTGAVAKDAIVFSGHKFVGGPGASGVLVLRDGIARRTTPSLTGGGTVRYVSQWSHLYSSDLVAREEAGTPDVIGNIRAALCLMTKEALGQDWIATRNLALRDRALAVWRDNPLIDLLGNPAAHPQVPLFAFRVRDGRGGFLPYQVFTRMLSDLRGIQARGGCACAGPYGHRLLHIDRARSERIRQGILDGAPVEKPGWVRLNLSYVLSDAKADAIITGLDELARQAPALARNYDWDPLTGRVTWARETPADPAPHSAATAPEVV